MKPLTPTELAHLASLRKTQSGFQQKPQYLYLPMPDYSERLNKEATTEAQRRAWVEGDWSNDGEATIPTVRLGDEDEEDTLPGIGLTIALDGDSEETTLPGLGSEEEPFLLLPEMQIVPDRTVCPCGKYTGRCGDPTSCRRK